MAMEPPHIPAGPGFANSRTHVESGDQEWFLLLFLRRRHLSLDLR